MTYAANVSTYLLEFSEVIKLLCLQFLKSKLLLDTVGYSYNTIKYCMKLNKVQSYVVSKHLCFDPSSCDKCFGIRTKHTKHMRNVLESEHNTPNT